MIMIENEWILPSDSIPPTDELVLVTFSGHGPGGNPIYDHAIGLGYYYAEHDDSSYFWDVETMSRVCDLVVHAWQPLPAAYDEEELGLERD